MNTNRAVPLIAQHVSWLSMDPLLGCPAQCSYCYLHPLGLTKSKPHEYIPPEQAYRSLLNHPHFKKIPSEGH